MFRYMMTLLNAFVLSLILTACGPGPDKPKLMRVTEENNEGTIDLGVGDKLEVVLESNPTTGYQWDPVVEGSPYLRLSGEPVYEPAGDEIGGGGKTIFTYEATDPGQIKLQLVYRQPFDNETPPVKTFEINVVIKR